jgi:signal recognition particle subunit SRP72
MISNLGCPSLTITPELCQASEDLTEEEKEAEMIPIYVQTVYLLLKLGRLEDAENLSKQFSWEK